MTDFHNLSVTKPLRFSVRVSFFLAQLCPNKHEENTNKMKRSLTSLFLLATVALSAQVNTDVKGTLFNQVTKSPLANTSFSITDLNIHSQTDEFGQYTVSIPDDVYEIEVVVTGFQSIKQSLIDDSISNVYLSPSDLSNEKIDLATAVITGNRNRSTEANLLNMQRRSVNLVQAIGKQELDRKGVADVATAVTKMSGIAKQEGSNSLFIRGLGDRYNSSTLNGLPIPSNDPEYKNIDMGLFTTDIVDYISVDKVYNGRFFGDFAGGNIDIAAKFPNTKPFFKVGVSGGLNSNAFGKGDFKLQQGPNFWGFNSSERPNSLNSYGFKNNLNPESKSAWNGGLDLQGGVRLPIGSGRLGIFASASFNNNSSAIAEGTSRAVNAQGVARKDLTSYLSNSYSTNSTGLLNLNYEINAKNTIKYSGLLINSSNQKLDEYQGTSIDVGDDNPVFIRRGTYVKNTLFINQLLGDHQLTDQLSVRWAAGYNRIKSDMPDRIQNTLKNLGNGYIVANNSTSDNNRYYQQLNEDEIVGKFELDYKFGKTAEDYKGLLTVGYNGRQKKRDLEAVQFNFKANYPHNQTVIDIHNLDAFFNQTNFNNGYFDISTYSGNSITPQFYEGDQSIHGGFANFQYQFNDRLTAVVGLRAETLKQKVKWNTSLDAEGNQNTFDDLMFLPSLLLKYQVNNKQNLRLAASKTYTLPQFKERALFMYEDVTETVFGWPTVYASTDYNLDLKWELFPTSGELISVTAFGKYIVDPINKLTIASSTNDLSYANTGDWGYVLGAELEIRKDIVKFSGYEPSKLSFGLNASYAYSNQELNSDKIYKETLLPNGSRLNANFTNKEDAFQGASDLILNADLSFNKEWSKGGSLMATVAYNYFSDRIYALGTNQKGNQVDKGFGTLDFILRSKVTKNLGINFSAKNLLNPSIDRVQDNATGSVNILHYKKGTNYGLSVSYEL